MTFVQRFARLLPGWEGERAWRVPRGWEEALCELHIAPATVVFCATGSRTRRLLATYQLDRWYWDAMGVLDREKILMSFIKSVTTTGAGALGRVPARDPELGAVAPALHEYITSLTGPEGESRKPCSLTLFTEDGVFKACLREPASQATLWASGSSIWEAFVALDGLLQAPVTPWRAPREGGGTTRTKGQGRA